MKTVYITLFLGFFGSRVFCMHNNSQFVEMQRQTEAKRQQLEAQYAATQRHYAEQSAINAQREQQRQVEERRRLDALSKK